MLRSRRLEALLGGPLSDLRLEHIQRLVDGAATEDADLEFKRELYGSSDQDKAKLATDVAAMANTRGGLLIIGIDENERGEASRITPVELATIADGRIEQAISSRVTPMPDIEVRTISCASDSDNATALGVVVISIEPSPRAPLAVTINGALRYSRRNGSHIMHLSEPEVAAAYRDRDLRAGQRGTRLGELREHATRFLDFREGPWLALVAMPEVPGSLRLGRELQLKFEGSLVGRDVGSVVTMGAGLRRARVARGYLWTDGQSMADGLSTWARYELHVDGSAVIAVRIPARRDEIPGEPKPIQRELINDLGLALSLINGIERAASFARIAGAGGALTLDARVIESTGIDACALMNTSGAVPMIRGSVPSSQDAELGADTVVELDDLDPIGTPLLAAVASLGDQFAQGFGEPELGYIDAGGNLTENSWPAQMLERLKQRLRSTGE